MATRGFEFVGMIDGSSAVPVVRDLPVHGTGAYTAGDLVLLASDGQVASVTNTTSEVTGVMQESRTAGADGDYMKVAIITRNQVWKCSTAGTSTTFVVGYTKTIDTVDDNTISHSDSSGGGAILWDTGTDDDGNVVLYVVFSDTTFGNA